MCVRKVGYLVAEKRFVAIPLLPPPPDKDATSKFVVEIQCSNRACRYRRRQEAPLMQSLAQCAHSCGNFSCFCPGCPFHFGPRSIAATLPVANAAAAATL
jgi:hypothetical protein